MNKEFLNQLIDCVSVSGEEVAIQRLIKSYMSDVVDSTMVDGSGNLVNIINDQAPQKVMLCAHADEIGFYINRIYSDGTLGVTKAGGVRAVLYLGTHVQIVSDQIVHGVVMSNSSLENKEKVVPSDLRIDIGCDSKEEAEKYVSVGNVVCAATGLQELTNSRFAARAVDDRGCVFIILEAIRRAQKLGAKVGMYAATTTGEETTRRGAYHAATNVKPDCAIIVDVTFASDYEGARSNEGGDISLGKGAALCYSSTVNKAMNKKMEEIAKRLNIPYQWEVSPGWTYTDGDIVHLTNEGVPIVLVSLPLRYMHSSIEMADYRDIEACIDLIAHFLCEMDASFSFIPEI